MKPETAVDVVDLDVADVEEIEQPHERTVNKVLGKHRPKRASGPPHRTGLPKASYRKAASVLLA